MQNRQNDFKVRMYILTCQNLAAVDSYVELKNMLAGDKAQCSAFPYPYITIGNGEKQDQVNSVKVANDRDSLIE